MHINGTADIQIESASSKAIITLDLQDGEIIVNPNDTSILDKGSRSIFDQDVSLTSFRGLIKAGKVFLSRFPNLFVTNYRNNLNQLDGLSLQSFEFLEKQTGSLLKLKPKSSRIELEFEPFSDHDELTEFHFIKVNNTANFSFEYDDKHGNAVLAYTGHAIIKLEGTLCPDKIQEFTNIFRVTCCLANGAYSEIREVFTPTKLLINLAGYNLKKPPHKIVPNEHIVSLFNSVKNTLQDGREEQINTLTNAIYYLEGGYGQTVDLEFRIISLFTAIEILDKSSSLDKNIIKSEFDIPSLYDSAFLIAVRNKLIHRGLSIQKSIKEAQNEIQETDKKDSEIDKLLEKFSDESHLAFYYYLLDLLTEHLIKKFNYDEEIVSNLSTLEK